MNKNKFTSALAFLSLSLGLAACGGGDGDGGSSGVEGSKALTELDATERQDLCDYGQSLISEDDSKSLGCYFGALFFSETEEECQTNYDACIAAPDESEETCSVDDEPPACAADVTVAEIEACAREQAAAVSTLANSLSCASDPSELENIEELPPACKAVETKCPELFEDDEQA